jgi:nucleoside triphosphate diphosphatase
VSDSHPSSPIPSPADLARVGSYPESEGALDRALALVAYLREHCPWDRKQTARSLVPHLLEETHETVDAIHADDPDLLRDELGDLLLNLAFQIVVAEGEGRFTRSDVVRRLEEKMVRRHPHLFGLGEKESWEVIKARERAEEAEANASPAHPTGEEGDDPAAPSTPPHGVLEGLAGGLDPLLRSHRLQEKAAGVGFDWDDVSGVLAKVREELDEVEAALASGDRGELEEEVGDLLFAVVNLARLADAHAVPALEAANAKFLRRFQAVEALARERGIPIPGASLEELDRLWDEVKEEE